MQLKGRIHEQGQGKGGRKSSTSGKEEEEGHECWSYGKDGKGKAAGRRVATLGRKGAP